MAAKKKTKKKTSKKKTKKKASSKSSVSTKKPFDPTGVNGPADLSSLSRWERYFFDTKTGYRRFMNTASYAAHRGLDVNYIKKLVSSEAIPVEKKINNTMFIDFKKADKIMDECGNVPSARTKTSDGETEEIPDYHESNRKKIFYEAEIKRIESDEKAGRLVERDAIEKKAFELGRMVREKILSIPARVAAQVVGEEDVGKIEIKLQMELEDALRELEQFKH